MADRAIARRESNDSSFTFVKDTTIFNNDQLQRLVPLSPPQSGHKIYPTTPKNLGSTDSRRAGGQDTYGGTHTVHAKGSAHIGPVGHQPAAKFDGNYTISGQAHFGGRSEDFALKLRKLELEHQALLEGKKAPPGGSGAVPSKG